MVLDFLVHKYCMVCSLFRPLNQNYLEGLSQTTPRVLIRMSVVGQRTCISNNLLVSCPCSCHITLKIQKDFDSFPQHGLLSKGYVSILVKFILTDMYRGNSGCKTGKFSITGKFTIVDIVVYALCQLKPEAYSYNLQCLQKQKI